MSNIDRVRRRRNIQMAEGYLDLIMVFDDRWPLDLPFRKTLADNAIECLSRIKQPLGHKPYILFLKGQAARSAERYNEAINYLQQSAKLDNENIHTFLALGWCYKRIDRLDLAIEAMEQAVELDNESAIAHYNLACYWALAEQSKIAILHLSNALTLNPEFRKFVAQESDFDPIRNDPDFQATMSVVV